jgi:Domain of unknown function (DUF4384)
MILSTVPLLALLLQASPSPVVHVSLDSRGPLARGRPVRVYVDLTQDGNLVVLHRRTDGRIEVLFPSRPGSDPFVHAGTYEIRRADTESAWVVAEPDGTGMVLAALSPDPLRVDEFVRQAAWNPDALVASWSGADGEGAMSDVVQRMLGDGYFNYDVVSYTVAPPVYAGLDQDVAPPPPQSAPDSSSAYAQSPQYPQCLDCTFIGEQVIIEAPFVRHHGFRGDRKGERAPAPTHALALALGPTTNPMPRPTPAPRFAAPRHADPSPAIEPRPRAANPEPLTHVRYTRLSAPTPDRPATLVMPRGRATEPLPSAASNVAPVAARGLAVASVGVRAREGEAVRREATISRGGAAAAAPAPPAAAAMPREAWGIRGRGGPARSGVGVRQR